MHTSHASDVLFVIGAIGAALGFIGVVFALNALFAPREPNEAKNEPYECGMPQAGSPSAPLKIRFTAIALLLVVFDAFVALLFAVGIGVRGNPDSLPVAGALVGLVSVVFVYAVRKGVFVWR